MNPKMIWSNLGVSDLARTTKFYTALGFSSNNDHVSDELTSFMVGEHDFVIHFFLRDILADSMKGQVMDAGKGNEVLFTLSAGSRAEADQWAKEVKAAGGNIISGPETFGKDYYGFVFADPDGHRFNVFHMKGLK